MNGIILSFRGDELLFNPKYTFENTYLTNP